MLVEARNLTRYYGPFLAVDHVSFTLERGEIVGLLGPNGAGKTTTIRMLTGFLPVSEGQSIIAGHDVHREPIEAARHIGYLPENNPLYPEMRVREYLSFRAELKGVTRRDRRRRIAECIEMCGVAEVAGQIVGTLSKGYRQRVGVADAMLAQPDVLVLDEPTVGLDPNQQRETRRLIRSLSERHTVLISTHILAEAEAICQRALIIDRGRVVADGRLGALGDAVFRMAVIAELQGDPVEMSRALSALKDVEDVAVTSADGWHRFTLTAVADRDLREDVFRLASRHEWPLRELTRGRASLDDVFYRITHGDVGEAEQ